MHDSTSKRSSSQIPILLFPQDSDDDEMSDDIATMGELSDDSDSDDSDTESLASSVAELSSGMPKFIFTNDNSLYDWDSC